jgi:predicted DNA-binding transcriptional regulator AlpA
MTRDPTSAPLDRLLTALETATILGLSLSWLAKSRLRGDGPLFIKLGRAVRYRESAIRDYLKACTRTSTCQT